MDPKRLSFHLGLFSVALGVAELAATRRIARALGQDGRVGRTTLRAFGTREMLAGAGLLSAPAHSTLVWGRVAGDALDLAALGLAARRAPHRRAIWCAAAFVAGATVLDIFVARALDRRTGRALPVGKAAGASLPRRHPTTIEPEDMPLVQAPQVPGQRKQKHTG